MGKIIVLLVLMSGGLWLSTRTLRTLAIPGLSSLESLIATDWKNLKSGDIPELERVGVISLSGSDEGGISKLWAREARLNCLAEKGQPLGAEILMIPVDTESGPGATVQISIYDIATGEFVREVSRLYVL